MKFFGARQLDSFNRGLLYLDGERNSQDIGMLVSIDSTPDLFVVKARLEQLVEAVPNLSFCVDQNTHSLSPAKSNWSAHDNFFKVKIEADFEKSFDDFIGSLCSKRLSPERPGWSITLIEDRKTNGPGKSEYWVLVRSHHILADGLSLIEICSFLGGSSKEKSLEEIHPGLPKFASRQSSIALGQQKGVTGESYFRAMGELVKDIFRKRSPGPLTGFNSGKRRLITFDLPLEGLRRLKKDYKCSLNDLVLNVVAGALDRYHQLKKIRPRETFVLVPVDLRKLSERSRIGNIISFFKLPLPNEQSDPIKRLSLISKLTKDRKDKNSERVYTTGGRFLYFIPAGFARWITKRVIPDNSLICTNMPHFRGEIFIAGSKVTGIYGITALLPGNGLGFSFVGYKDHYNVSIIADPNVVPDAELLQETCLSTYNSLVSNQSTAA